ncbi:hypothetical protein J6590_079105 [Homalodisca vitripennis]|nr:hypothetical protein J6590_079105 [Homalodisca vitripennis]
MRSKEKGPSLASDTTNSEVVEREVPVRRDDQGCICRCLYRANEQLLRVFRSLCY